MENDSDASNLTLPDPVRYFVGAWYSVMAVLGLALVMSVLLTTVKLKGPKLPPFYMFLTNLCLADATLFFIYLVYVVPCVLTSSQVYGIVAKFSLIGFLESTLFTTVACNSFLISINRFFCICFHTWEDIVFTRKISVCLALTTWCVGVTVNVLNIFVSCVTIFNEKKFTFSTICVNIPGALSIGSFMVYLLVYGVAFCYIFIVCKLWKLRKAVGNQQIAENMTRRQMNMFFQALCIWLSLLSNAIAFRLMPFVLSDVALAMGGTIMLMCPSYVTSICVIVFSKQIRMGIKKMLIRDKMLFTVVNNTVLNQRSQFKNTVL